MMRTASRGALVVVACLLAAGCGGTDDSAPTAQPSTEPTPSGVPATVDQDDWLSATVEIAQPDGLAVLDGMVYVRTDEGHVVRVDGASAAVTADADVDTFNDAGHYCQGIGSDGSSLWTCSAGRDGADLVRLDPDTLEVTDRVHVDKVFDQLTLPVVGGRVWALSGTGDRISAVDASTGEVRTRALGRRCFQVAATPTRAYASCFLTDEVIALDAATLRLVGTAEVPHPVNISVSGDDVWVSGSTGLQRLSSDLQPVATYDDLAAGPEGDLVATPDAVWVRQSAGFLFRLDPATGATTQYLIDPVPTGGSVLVTDDAVWASAYNDNVVYRIIP